MRPQQIAASDGQLAPTVRTHRAVQHAMAPGAAVLAYCELPSLLVCAGRSGYVAFHTSLFGNSNHQPQHCRKFLYGLRSYHFRRWLVSASSVMILSERAILHRLSFVWADRRVEAPRGARLPRPARPRTMHLLNPLQKKVGRSNAGARPPATAPVAAAAAAASPPLPSIPAGHVAASLASLQETDTAGGEEREALRSRLQKLLQSLGVEGAMDTDRFAAALYIEAHDFEAALSHCAPTDTQLHDAIIMAQAVSEFGRGEHVRAAVLYAKTRVPVEQAALKFHDAGLIRALRHYLSDIVDRVDDANASQLTLLCAWLTQIYVSDTDMAGGS